MLDNFSAWRAWDFNPSVGLVIAGGHNNKFGSEISRDYGVTFQDLPLMPKAMYAGCIQIVNSSQTFYFGGIDCKFLNRACESQYVYLALKLLIDANVF